MKPIFRWTIGDNVGRNGFEILNEAIYWLWKNFHDEFDLYICYNFHQKDKSYKHELLRNIAKPYPITLYEQKWDSCPIPHTQPGEVLPDGRQPGSLWKICPPRLDINRHEIISDNDLVITKRINEMVRFLRSSKHTLLLEDPIRFLGRYEGLHNKTNFNSGLMGLPPGFDFGGKIREVWEMEKHDGLHYGDEQGLLTYVLTTQQHFIIGKKKLIELHYNHFFYEQVFEDRHDRYRSYTEELWAQIVTAAEGYHFVQANRYPTHEAWNMFCRTMRKTVMFDKKKLLL